MERSIEQIFDRVRELSSELAATNDEKRRKTIEAERNALRSEAAALALDQRHPASVEAELEMLVDRLAEIDSLFATKGYAEKHLTKGFSDPGAYSANINRLISDNHAAEIKSITDRIVELGRTTDGASSE